MENKNSHSLVETAILFSVFDSETTSLCEKPIVLLIDFAEVRPWILIPVIFIQNRTIQLLKHWNTVFMITKNLIWCYISVWWGKECNFEIVGLNFNSCIWIIINQFWKNWDQYYKGIRNNGHVPVKIYLLANYYNYENKLQWLD